MHSSVKELEGSIDHIRADQQYANTGIYLLCRSATLLCIVNRTPV